MRTSQQWWDEVKRDDEKFNDWLIKQFRGEVTAAGRIERVAKEFEANPQAARTLKVIADQERQHAAWVFDLLKARNVLEPSPFGYASVLDGAEDRYWSAVEAGAKDFEHACAVAAHAEAMRLERIRVIKDDADTPDDVREVFAKILKDEVFHEAAFRKLAGDLAMSDTQADHEAGRRLLGLVV